MDQLVTWTTLLNLAVITALGGISAITLVLAQRKFAADEDTLVAEINQLLPQTQCAQCGYPGCKPYAEAIKNGEAINRCPPGGEETIRLLGELLGQDPTPLDPDCGDEPQLHVVRIDEAECIGCTLCLPACPVDAIIGAAGMMHTVVTSHCTGCDLCIEPCPVDCITIAPQSDSKQGSRISAELATEKATSVDQSQPKHSLEPVHPEHDQPCINCGFCADACPRALQPQLLYLHRLDIKKSDNLRLDACIECRLCDTSCPSQIPLTQNFQVTKALKRISVQAKKDAADAETRYLAHVTRQTTQSKRVVARPSANDRAELLAQLRQQKATSKHD